MELADAAAPVTVPDAPAPVPVLDAPVPVPVPDALALAPVQIWIRQFSSPDNLPKATVFIAQGPFFIAQGPFIAPGRLGL